MPPELLEVEPLVPLVLELEPELDDLLLGSLPVLPVALPELLPVLPVAVPGLLVEPLDELPPFVLPAFELVEPRLLMLPLLEPVDGDVWVLPERVALELLLLLSERSPVQAAASTESEERAMSAVVRNFCMTCLHGWDGRKYRSGNR